MHVERGPWHLLHHIIELLKYENVFGTGTTDARVGSSRASTFAPPAKPAGETAQHRFAKVVQADRWTS